LAEPGLAGFDAGTTHSNWAAAETRTPVIEVMRALGAKPAPISPAQLAAVIRSDSERCDKTIRERQITGV